MIDIKVPAAGESITQVELAKWLVSDGDYVEKDQEIAEIDSDKATLTINADDDGVIKILMEEGTSTEPGKVIGQIDNSVKREKKKSPEADESAQKEPEKPTDETEQNKPREQKAATGEKPLPTDTGTTENITFSPQARKLMDELGIDPGNINENPDNKRITRKDILMAIASQANDQTHTPVQQQASTSSAWKGGRDSESIKMTTLRKKIAERLVAVRNETAMLTTFNEVDMSAIMNLRDKYKTLFQEKHGMKPGFMSFFVKAVTSSLAFFPQVNGQIDDGHVIIPGYVDIGIAVSTPKGLMVPNIRNAESKSLAELEQDIASLAKKARDNKITIEELTGGTFSITNGGVFGSMLSTPIINPPQSAILGMHNIVDRAVVINGKIEIRPIMYVALSYDHRIIDGRESVGFLVKVKEFLENPLMMLYSGKNPEQALLGL